MNIPSGKIVTIKSKSGNIFDSIEVSPIMTIDTEITINLQSQFESLIGNTTQKILSGASAAIYAWSGKSLGTQFKAMGYKYWTGTNPVEFSFSTTFHMKTSGKKDVLDPAKVLMRLALPTEANTEEGFGLIAPGPSVLDALGVETQFGEKYSFRCGSFYLPSVVFEKAEPTWSSEVDDEGYPIWCTVQVDLTSIYTATTQMIGDFVPASR